MSEHLMASPQQAGWNVDMVAAVCERCQWRFLAQSSSVGQKCPHCHQQILTLLPDGLPDMPYPYPPELIVPFSLSQQSAQLAIKDFAKEIPYPPADLHPQTLTARLTPVFLPIWLVDASVCGNWQAEAGFDYQVVSHQEFYNQDESGWQTRELKEGRVRWEKRVGRLNRIYQNISTPALEDAPRLRESLGMFQQASDATAYQPEQLQRTYVRLPDFPPEEAWKEASNSFQKAAADECQQACAADHLREFHLNAEFSGINWTLLLVPVYTSYYLDDAGQPQPVLIHGQFGYITGLRRASMQRARHTSLTLLLVGIILFLVGLILDSFGATSLLHAAPMITLIGIVCSVASFVPIAAAWDFNRKQSLREAEVQLK